MEQAIQFAIVVAPLTLEDGSGKIPEPGFYKRLSLLGKRCGIQVYVCSAESFDSRSRQLNGWYWSSAGWSLRPAQLPDIVYNRCFYQTAEQHHATKAMLNQLARLKPYKLLGGSLPGKLEVYGALQRHDFIRNCLPVSYRYQPKQHTTAGLLVQFPEGVVLKPSAGMQGRGVLHIGSLPDRSGVLVTGRSASNDPIYHRFKRAEKCDSWLQRAVGGASYLIQPYLKLRAHDDRPFDVRILLQKDETGSWAITGGAVRSGSPGSLTSNLHGGGTAEAVNRALCTKFSLPKAEHLEQELHTISKLTATALENNFGRLAELGLDFGIEPNGRIWLLEANSKPGRSSFRMMNDHETWRLSAERPLRYASWLASRSFWPATTGAKSAVARHI